MTVASLGVATASLSCVTVACSVTVASPTETLPSGAVIEIDPPVATEPALVKVRVYVPRTGPALEADGSNGAMIGSIA